MTHYKDYEIGDIFLLKTYSDDHQKRVKQIPRKIVGFLPNHMIQYIILSPDGGYVYSVDISEIIHKPKDEFPEYYL